jgi:hypothetical protein
MSHKNKIKNKKDKAQGLKLEILYAFFEKVKGNYFLFANCPQAASISSHIVALIVEITP